MVDFYTVCHICSISSFCTFPDLFFFPLQYTIQKVEDASASHLPTSHYFN